MPKFKVGDYVRYKGEIAEVRIVETEGTTTKYQIGVLNPIELKKYLFLEWVEEADIQSA